MGEDRCSENEGQVIPISELISCFRSDQTDLLFNGSGGSTFGAFEKENPCVGGWSGHFCDIIL